MTKALPTARNDYRQFETLGTRWMDNDVYGHVNNVVYYSWFDTAINRFLIEQQLLDFVHGEVIGLVVDTQCQYFESITFPESVEVGIRVLHVGRSSVQYGVGIFKADQAAAAAQGRFVHVYVDRTTRRPVEIPVRMREVLSSLSAHTV